MTLSIQTPLLYSSKLSQLNQCQVWLKMESSQPTGSFKLRSIGRACESHARQGAQHFICSSGGNAGIAVAYAARMLNLKATIVVPETTSAKARDLIEQQGAHLIVHGASWVEANNLALSLVDADSVYIHPFDDPLLWDGVAELIDEVIAEGLTPDAVVLSVGGGSLLSGVIQGLDRHQLAIPIYAVETEGTASLHAAMQAGQHVSLDQVTGIATTLAARQVCKQAFELSQNHDVHSLKVTDQDTVTSCLAFLDDQRILVEPACGASLSVLYQQKIQFKPTDRVLVIVCGGAGIDLKQLMDYQA
ncbi:pyridoxal-phosphate dependent enzyme [Acinetobacter rudis]|uniref:L-serine ammonia-lyase n=1 Tax=Acinetobacter rudis CIP 110305 TaxID=421052 RepID=S3NKR5_9GAMM|nr:pyridoxal-phosphate dependent enzyme [Acinetobacter rudis]EPF80675.1 hypothetical protein F945_00418 [Acinetobacter rudis CIP 110305]